MVPVNDLTRHVGPLRQQLNDVAGQVIASGCFVLGPRTSAFESAFASYCGVEEVVGVANGTDALELALRALGVARGHAVAMVANAGMYGATAALACGATPCYVDVEASSATMDPACLERLLRQTGTRPAAVIVTHLYGRLADMPRLCEVARAYGVPVVEDCAQAHGARGKDGRRAGSYGDVACFSFYPTKNLGALGDGGAVATNDPALAGRVRRLRQYGWSAKYRNELAGGRNSRLDELQAAFLCVMLPLLDGWNARRREIAEAYSRGIVHPRIQVPAVAGEEYTGHLYVVRSADRVGLQAHLARLNVASEVHYPIADTQQTVMARMGGMPALPVTEALCGSVLSLPCFPELDEVEVARVIEACNAW
ncbi:DegT/DnrJ/EryC1/StrS family aminotransferase [Rhodanobacter sp. Si-c]|uniref:DegT/DnrJ/EryC1/StrS family aminotransferase n=1 Tax=Rhodanobacter lycopersici TaxID=3162487 RepID=A0ABV3QI86_9GAMM